MQHRRVDGGRADGVDSNAAGPQFHCSDLRQSHHPTVRGCVRDVPGNGEQPLDRGGVDDRRSRSPKRGAHPDSVDYEQHFHFDVTPEVARLGVGETMCIECDARVVQQHVDGATSRGGGGQRPLHCLGIGYVGRYGLSTDVVCRCGSGITIQVESHRVCSGGAEHGGTRCADARAGAGNHGGPSRHAEERHASGPFTRNAPKEVAPTARRCDARWQR